MTTDLTRPRSTLPPDPGEELFGKWFWVKGEDGEEPWLGCVTYLGSNYAKLTMPTRHGTSSARVHFNEFEATCTPEPDAEGYFRRKVEAHQHKVAGLLEDVQRLTAGLGLTPRGALPTPGGTSSALARVSGEGNVHIYKEALQKAKKTTLPELFEQIQEETEAMTTWLKAPLVPLRGQVAAMERVGEKIEDRIFAVELYAGLLEELVQVKDGTPAADMERVALFQRRHYMDEECLAHYQAGGMRFHNVKDFDAWLVRPENLERLLPRPRCAVAFRVRRYDFEDDTARASYWDWVRFWQEMKKDRRTYLYLRNGEQVYRLSTALDFGERLFPEREYDRLHGRDLWIQIDYSSRIAVLAAEDVQTERDRLAKKKAEYHAAKRAWKKLSEAEREGKCEPHYFSRESKYEPLSPESIFYDDAMKLLADEVAAHNRIATVLQGLLDRSPAFHPHPPWQLYTPEGFRAGVELLYDDSRALTTGDPSDFEAYRARLNASLEVGSLTVGQEDFWEMKEAVKESEREHRRHHYDHKRFRPSGDPGPGCVAPVVRVFKKNKDCVFAWEKDSSRLYGGRVKRRLRVPAKRLLNVSAYQPGDFKQFFADPRTRANYLKWAPLLLPAEDYVLLGKKEPDEE